jgi:uncharacterized membrane protein
LEIKAHMVVIMIVLMMFGLNHHQDVDAATAVAAATMVATLALVAGTVAVFTVKMMSAAWVPTIMFVFHERIWNGLAYQWQSIC